MACQIQTDKYTDVVLDLIKLDPSVYNNFDNAAALILKSGLLPEQKMMSLHNIAHIYTGLSGLDATYYSSGKAADVINTEVAFSEDPQLYVEAVSDLYGISRPSTIKIDSILKKINALGGKTNMTRLDLVGPDGILTLIENFFNSTNFPTLEERQQVLSEVSAAIRGAVMERKITADRKDFFLGLIEDSIGSLNKTSEFIPTTEVVELANLDNVLVILKDGRMVEAISENDKLYVVLPDNSLQEIPASEIEVAKDSRLSDRSKSNAGEHVFYEDAMLSNFRVKAINPEEESDVLKKLNNMPSPMAGVRIHAVQISDVADRRVSRMQAIAESNPRFQKLANRQHETFENSTQVAYLQSKSDGKVLTLSRPKASEQSFVLVGEIIGSGERFYLYPNENFAFVNSDNTTERVDFTNPVHLKEVQKTSVKQNSIGEKSQLAEEDLQKLAEAAGFYSDFKATLQEALDSAFAGGSTSVDITEEFFGAYDMNQGRTVRRKTSLSQEIETDPTLSMMLTVVNTVTGVKEDRKIPFIYNLKGSQESSVFMLVDVLGPDEMIEITDAQGNAKTGTLEQYAEEKLGINHDMIMAMLPATDKNQRNLMIKFNSSGKFTYKIVENVRQLDQMEEFATFLLGLVKSLGKDKYDKVYQFDNFSYTFRGTSAAKAEGQKKTDIPLYVSFTTARGKLAVKLRPRDPNGRYGFILEKDPTTNKYKNLAQFDFIIDEDQVINIAKQIIVENPNIAKIKESVPALAALDLKKEDDLYAFYRAVNQMTRNTSADPIMTALAEDVQNLNNKFTQLLIDSVVNKMEAQTKEFPQFMENIRKDFTYNGVFKPYYLVAQDNDNGSKTANIAFAPKYKPGVTNAKKRFMVSMDNYKVLNSDHKRLVIVPKAASAMSKPAPAPVTASVETPVVQQHVQNSVQGPVLDVNDIPEVDLFSMGSTEVPTETKEERLVAAEWLRQTLPMFTISPEDLSELIDLAKIDGTVLGAFKNKVIYLNDAIKSKGVIYHEAFHGVFRYLMTPEERQALTSQVKKNKTHASKFTEAALKEFARQRNYVYNKERMENLQAEEILADGFQNYMNKGTKPKGVLGKLMELLKRLIDMFTGNSNYIDTVYSRIKRGYYRTEVANSGLYDGEVAFELIPGLKTIQKDASGTGLQQKVGVLTVDEQNQLVYMMTKYFVKDNVTGESFDEKFDRLSKIVLDKEFNLDRLIAQSPSEKEAILKEFGPLYSQYRFMLGARLKGEKLSDINESGLTEYDDITVKNTVKKKTIDGVIQEENTAGEYSYELLKKLVKKEYQATQAILDGTERDEDAVTPETMEAAFDEDGAPITREDDEDGSNSQEVEESMDYDAGLNQHNRLQSLPKEIRRFLALVSYEQQHPTLNIKVPRLINGDKMFAMLLRISSDINPENIIQHVLSTAAMQRKNGNITTANDLEAIYNNLKDFTKMDSNGTPQTNLQLFNMMIDVLHGTELDYLMTNMYTSQKKMEDITETTTYGYSIKDKVLYEDISNRKARIVKSIIAKHTEAGSTEQYKKDITELAKLAKKIAGSTFLLSSFEKSQGTLLNEYVDKMHDLMGKVGINIPKSLLSLSLMAIDREKNKVIHDDAQFDKAELDHYNNHSVFIGERKYLEQEFFEDLNIIFTRAEDYSNDKFAQMLDDSNTKDLNINRFNAILGKAAAYVVKYDPTELQSTVRNAEGKPIYRYVKYTPALTVAQALRSKGVVETLSEDPYYATQLEEFFKDNPMMGDIFNKKDTETAQKVNLMLKNFRVALYGGVVQSINNKFKEGKTFKNIDEKSMYILNLTSFLNRSTYREIIKNADGTKKEQSVETFMRSFSQLEASQTNFLVSAMYQSYADRNGLVKNADGRVKIVDVLEGVVRQEYKRIAREYGKRIDRKAEFDAGASNELILKYNAELDKLDKTKADVEKDGLRAYQFNKMPEFFKANPELYTSLLELAKENKAFEEIDAEVKTLLLDALNDYALDALKKHTDRLENIGVVTRETKVKNTRAGQPETIRGRQQTYNVYDSALIATTLKVDGQPAGNALEKYAKTPENFSPKTEGQTPQKQDAKPNMEGLIQDAFFNFWANSLSFNDLLDGDIAMNVKDPVDYFKRHKKFLAAGSTMKRGTHRVAYMNTIAGYIHEDYPTYGPYYSVEEIDNDPRLASRETNAEVENIYNTLVKDFGGKAHMREIFDGQSISTLLHQIDLHDAMGRMSPEIMNLMIAKHYRKLTQDEVKLMQDGKVVNNPKKTVTAARNSYHKQSENYIDRNDVSVLEIPEAVRAQGSQAIRDYIKDVHDRIHGLYMDTYSLRKQIQDAKEAGENTSELVAAIEKNMREVHGYYRPSPHREILHDLLNAMEFHQIDQLMDTTASKNATLLPVDYYAEKAKSKPYINLALSSLDVDNKYKYLQVETSGVKDMAKFSVQAKALIAADLVNLATIAEKSGKEVTESDRKAIEQIAGALSEYQSTLKAVGKANLINLKTILRKDGDFEIGKVFNMIRESLEAQGAPTNTLKLFEVTPEGKPVHSPNLPGIRSMLEYYFFAKYSKYVTDEKRSGFKNIHISSFGYNVLTDENGKLLVDKEGNTVTTEMYRRNPSKYPAVKSRPLGIDVQENPDGTKTYFVEAIVPLPYFRSAAHKEFYMKNLTKMFGVRIPTEDKRSMVVLKAVDFIDSSNMNGIIVPHFVHLLAGSDFDVDALYGQTMAHYFNADNTPVLYGDYSAYKTESQGKYVEFVQYLTESEDMAPAIQFERDRISNMGEDYQPSANAQEIAGFIADRLSEDDTTLKEFDAILAAFQRYGLPVNLYQFEANPNFAQVVRPVHQNANLKSMMDILSNEAVHKFLYINERSSVERFEQIAEAFGRNVDEMATGFNHYTVDGLIATKKATSMNKDGIGITANINKFLALASQYGLELKNENVIWSFQDVLTKEDGSIETQLKKYSNFGTLNEENQRVIALIGNILGMFADGAKKPIPSALGMNETNAGVTLAMIGVGLSPEFAIGFNFIPEIVKAVGTVQSAKYAVSEDMGSSFVFLNNEVGKELRDYIYQNPAAFDRLKELGVLTPRSSAFKVAVNRERINMKFNAQKLDQAKLDDNTISTKEIGFEIRAVIPAGAVDPETEKKSTTATTIPLNEQEQRIILLQMYAEQAQQTFAIRRAGSLLNMFKKLNPNFVSADKLMSNILELKENGEKNIFTEESVARIFDDSQIWPELLAAMEDLQEQASKIFLERTEFFAPIKKAFEGVFTNHAEIAKIITSFVALRKYQMTNPKVTGNAVMDQLVAENFQNLKNTFTAEHAFTNNLPEMLEDMQKKYPDNKFLQMLRSEKTDNIAFTTKGKPVNERIIKLVGRSKISGKFAEEISDAAEFLMYRENMFMNQLYQHSLAVTGLQYKAGSFLQYFNPDVQIPLSNFIQDFIGKLEATRGNRYELVNAFKEFLGEEASVENVYEFLNEMFILLGNAASTEVGNTKIRPVDRFSLKEQSSLMKAFKFDKENDRQKRAVAFEVMKHFMGMAPESDRTGYSPKAINSTIVLDMSVPKTIPQANQQVMDELAKKFGVKASFDNPGKYAFPLMFKIEGNTYLLQGVDDQMENSNFGETMLKSIVGTGKYTTVGKSAKYVLIPKELTAGTISPIGLTKQESEKYMNYVKKRERLNIAEPVAPAETKAETKAAEVTDEMAGAVDASDLLLSLTAKAAKVVTGDIFTTEGIPVITTNLGGVHGAGLAQAAKQRGLVKQGDGAFKATDSVVQLPVKQVWSDSMDMNNNMELLKESLRSLIRTARANSEKTYLLPLAGLGHGEGSVTQIVPLLIATVQAADNIKLVIPAEGVNLGRQGTVRKDNTRTNLPQIREMLIEAGLLENPTSQVNIDLDNLNLTQEVMDLLYEQSSKRDTKQKFAETVAEIVANLRASFTPQEILEKIKCL